MSPETSITRRDRSCSRTKSKLMIWVTMLRWQYTAQTAARPSGEAPSSRADDATLGLSNNLTVGWCEKGKPLNSAFATYLYVPPLTSLEPPARIPGSAWLRLILLSLAQFASVSRSVLESIACSNTCSSLSESSVWSVKSRDSPMFPMTLSMVGVLKLRDDGKERELSSWGACPPGSDTRSCRRLMRNRERNKYGRLVCAECQN